MIIMDPNATVLFIHQSIGDGSYREAMDACVDLRGWIERGGFLPDHFESKEHVHQFLTVTLRYLWSATGHRDRVSLRTSK